MKFGSGGSADGSFTDPTGLASDSARGTPRRGQGQPPHPEVQRVGGLPGQDRLVRNGARPVQEPAGDRGGPTGRLRLRLAQPPRPEVRFVPGLRGDGRHSTGRGQRAVRRASALARRGGRRAQRLRHGPAGTAACRSSTARTYQAQVGTSGSGNGHLAADGIDVDSGNNPCVMDMGNHAVQKFNSVPGLPSPAAATPGARHGRLAVDGSDNRYIAVPASNLYGSTAAPGPCSPRSGATAPPTGSSATSRGSRTTTRTCSPRTTTRTAYRSSPR